MGRLWSEQKGASVVEYVLILPTLLLLLLGTAEVLRIMSVKRSLQSGLRQAAPYFTHRKELAEHYGNPRDVIVNELAKNRFAVGVDILEVTPDDGMLDSLDYGQVFEIEVIAEAAVGALYPIEGLPRVFLRATYQTFIDSDPAYYGLNPRTPFPKDPGDL